MTSAVSLQTVSRHFGAVRALDEVDLEVGEGEFFAMLGPSGSGKTTCLRLIAGFEQPTLGQIRIFGDAVEGVPPYRRNVNTVFQDYALFPHMNVRENVEFSLMLKRVDKATRAREAEAALELVKLGGYGDRRPGQLSGGQRQRVALARAIVNRPKVLLLDEPLGALDLKLREQMQEELKALQKTLGITFIFVTHDQGEALSMADRVAVFDFGKLVQVGTPEEIYTKPNSRFVADFVGSSNVLAPEFVETIAGERRWASLRPEAIHLLRSEGGHSALTGTVVSRSYLGATTRLGIELGGTLLHAVVPSGTDVPADGARVTIGFAREALHLMEDAG
ncbi:polyamine ABC transporter ATP-binding protein [Devosia sp. Root413D1]|uniref:ABC transporter ATP-binding protein n=1 Tax=Devosia sp. Root413D1 TaxID=1736531 RepID=UPI0007013AE4|nr:ABC transporter ATP-binding protein [Devosia sp. Root413D1]KQW77506.1 polyamine ABC transporter ATP-binding protein [Devosia sp. Root413D1]